MRLTHRLRTRIIRCPQSGSSHGLLGAMQSVSLSVPWFPSLPSLFALWSHFASLSLSLCPLPLPVSLCLFLCLLAATVWFTQLHFHPHQNEIEWVASDLPCVRGFPSDPPGSLTYQLTKKTSEFEVLPCKCFGRWCGVLGGGHVYPAELELVSDASRRVASRHVTSSCLT